MSSLIPRLPSPLLKSGIAVCVWWGGEGEGAGVREVGREGRGRGGRDWGFVVEEIINTWTLYSELLTVRRVCMVTINMQFVILGTNVD